MSDGDPLTLVVREFARTDPQADRGAVGPISDLIVRCGRGDEGAMGRLFDLFHAPVTAALGLELDARSADDLVIGAFVRLWSAAPTYRPQDQDPVEWVLHQAGACGVDGT